MTTLLGRSSASCSGLAGGGFSGDGPTRQRANVVTRSSLLGKGRGLGRGSDYGSGDGGLLLPGNPGGRGQGNRQPQKLVIPGKPSGVGPPGGGGRLVIPEQGGMDKMLAEGAASLGPEVVTMTGPNRYRPPAGFMDEAPKENPEVDSLSHEEMISKLRARAGRWHTLAKFFVPLNQAGYDSATLDQLIGLTPAVQNRWSVAATVFDSLAASPKVPPHVLDYFASEGDELLYPIRFLNSDLRIEAALYIAEQLYDAAACDVLARAMKEWERRPAERSGFSDKPGDCMAFKYMRDAFECRKLEEAEKKMEKALAAAVTEGARARLAEALDALRGNDPAAAGAASPATSAATLSVLRLDPGELGFRPLPVLGVLGQASAQEMAGAPRTSQEGAFGAFTITGQDAQYTWVALPQWKALAMMRHPVVVSIADCAAVPAIAAGTKCKSDDDRKRLSGAGLVVAEKESTQATDADEGSFYLATAGPGLSEKLQLVDGATVKSRNMQALATVVFVARPPARDQPVTTSDSLIQL